MTGRMRMRSGCRFCSVARGVARIAYRIASAASRPGTTLTSIALRVPTSATSPIASSGPPIAPRLSIARSNPYARPYASDGTTSASSALRAGTRSPRDDQAATRRAPTCQTPVVIPISDEKTAVAV